MEQRVHNSKKKKKKARQVKAQKTVFSISGTEKTEHSHEEKSTYISYLCKIQFNMNHGIK